MQNILIPAVSSFVFLLLQSPRLALGVIMTALPSYLWCRAVDWVFDRGRTAVR
jgi:hypothetical protein